MFEGATFYLLSDGECDECGQPHVLGGASDFGLDNPDLMPQDMRTRESTPLLPSSEPPYIESCVSVPSACMPLRVIVFADSA